jgi:hypothetical protein
LSGIFERVFGKNRSKKLAENTFPTGLSILLCKIRIMKAWDLNEDIQGTLEATVVRQDLYS